MIGFVEAGRQGLRGIGRFSGRSPRSAFWFYILWLVLGYQLLSAVLVFAVVFSQFMSADPLVTIGAGQNIETGMPPFLRLFGLVIAGVVLLILTLIAAAVTRRLHDSNLRGWWGLLPLPFLLIGAGVFAFVFGSGQPPNESTFFLIFFNNLIYLAALGVLVVLLCRRSTLGPNRYGPGPLLPPVPPQPWPVETAAVAPPQRPARIVGGSELQP